MLSLSCLSTVFVSGELLLSSSVLGAVYPHCKPSFAVQEEEMQSFTQSTYSCEHTESLTIESFVPPSQNPEVFSLTVLPQETEASSFLTEDHLLDSQKGVEDNQIPDSLPKIELSSNSLTVALNLDAVETVFPADHQLPSPFQVFTEVEIKSEIDYKQSTIQDLFTPTSSIQWQELSALKKNLQDSVEKSPSSSAPTRLAQLTSVESLDWQEIHRSRSNHPEIKFSSTPTVWEQSEKPEPFGTDFDANSPFILSQGENPFPVLNDNDKELFEPNDSESSSERSQDPELGILRLEEIEAKIIRRPRKRRSPFYLIGNFGYLRNENIRSSPVDPVGDDLFSTGVTLLTVVPLSSQTLMIGSVGGSFVSYANESQFDYDKLKLNLGINHRFDRTWSGKIGWSNRQLFDGEDGSRFLNDQTVYLEVEREDKLSSNLSLNSSYEFKTNFSEPTRRSKITNSLALALEYQINPQLKTELEYELTFSNFTERDRDDTYHQLIASLRYKMSPYTSLDFFGGHRFGNSSRENLDFDGLIFGAGINFYLF